MNPRLSILICTMHNRKAVCDAMVEKLRAQASEEDVEILVYPTRSHAEGGQTRGAKRQELLERATGTFIVFRDDDDPCPEDYCQNVLPHCIEGVDCIGHLFDCYGYVHGRPYQQEKAIVSNRYKDWKTNPHNDPRYERSTHHLVPVRREHALKAGFDPKKDNGEDYAYSMRLQKLGLLKKEVFIDKVLYVIHHNPNKKPGT